ncbi:gibberellin-regulated protein 6-like [Silene latifolia]|uniref:gibberellin-regulated protein 6-like n=1 Tax=Silene latifolia TaxID=37657 RepID=UPI003D77C590
MNNKVFSIILFALIAFAMFANEAMAGGYGQGSLRPYQCLPQCTRRCSNTRYHKPCMFFCQKCCNKCLCVPPGTYGNKQVCPCYNNWKTQQGGPKCP